MIEGITDDAILRQLAAIIDDYGRIEIARHKAKNQKYSYTQRLSVFCWDIDTARWLVETFHDVLPKHVTWKPEKSAFDGWIWVKGGGASYELIKGARDFLSRKWDQADCAITLYENVTMEHYGSGNPMPDDQREYARALYQQCKERNAKGTWF